MPEPPSPAWLDLCVGVDTTIRDTMRVIDRGHLRFALVVDEGRRLIGFVSDGDVRRALLAGEDVGALIGRAMTPDPVAVRQAELDDPERLAEALGRVRERHGLFVPVLDPDDVVTDVRTIEEIERLQRGHFVPAQVVERGSRAAVSSVLVIGGAGYLGSVLVRRLLESGYRVRVLDILLFGPQSLEEVRAHPRFELVRGDLRHIDEVVAALQGMDACVLLAAIVGDPASKANPGPTIETNFLAAKTVAEACRYQQTNRFLYASTCSVYGVGAALLDEASPLNPVSLYARTKIISEQGMLALADENFAPCALRLATLYGPSPRMRYDLVVNTLTMHACTRRRIVIHGGMQWRPLLHVRDAGRAFQLALEAPIEAVRGQTFNVGSDAQNYRIRALGELVSRCVGDVEVVIEETAADARDYRVGFAKIERTLGFRPEETVEGAVREMHADLLTGRLGSPTDSRYYNHLVAY